MRKMKSAFVPSRYRKSRDLRAARAKIPDRYDPDAFYDNGDLREGLAAVDSQPCPEPMYDDSTGKPALRDIKEVLARNKVLDVQSTDNSLAVAISFVCGLLCAAAACLAFISFPL